LEDGSKTMAYDERPYAPISHHRPPRLPLPIAEPGVMPDSPNLPPVDKNDSDVVPLFDADDHTPLGADASGRRNSMLSIATQEEEDISEELQPYGVGITGQTVPTVIEWNQAAEKVFVTGTFAAWDKKFRLKKRYVSHLPNVELCFSHSSLTMRVDGRHGTLTCRSVKPQDVSFSSASIGKRHA